MVSSISFRKNTFQVLFVMVVTFSQENIGDYKKLRHAVKYLCCTKHLPLVLEADNICVLEWWVDGAFATHKDM